MPDTFNVHEEDTSMSNTPTPDEIAAVNAGDFAVYARLAGGTAIYPDCGKGTPQAIVYCVLGLQGEIAEYMEDPSAAELGDVWWYVAALARELGVVDLLVNAGGSQGMTRSPLTRDRLDVAAITQAARMGNAAKKLLRDGDKPAKRHSLTADLLRIWDWLLALTEENHFLGEVWVCNLQKLYGRAERGTLQGDGGER